MKTLYGIISIIVLCVTIAAATQVNVSNYAVSVSTNSTQALAENAARKGVVFTNTDSSYCMYIATAPVTKDTYETVGALAIPPNTIYIDDFYVYKSTWYVCGSTDAVTGKLHISEKE